MSLQKTRETYAPLVPSPGELTREDLEQTDLLLRQYDFETMRAWTQDPHRLKTYELANGQAFRMVVDQPEDADPNQVVIVAGEYNKGLDPDHVLRARILGRIAAPRATLLYQPTATMDNKQNNMNFSQDERRELRRGSLNPLMGRFGLALESLGDPGVQTIYGSSQGATVALGYAAHKDTPKNMAVTVYEPPNVVDRSTLKMMIDFVGNSKKLEERFAENYDAPDPAFAQDWMAAQSFKSFITFSRGLILPENLAMIKLMAQASAEAQMRTILEEKNGSVVHVFGSTDKVSPEHADVRLKRLFESNERYRGVRISEKKKVGHEGSLLLSFNGALARTARQLIDQPT